jgi:hypothetical protein
MPPVETRESLGAKRVARTAPGGSGSVPRADPRFRGNISGVNFNLMPVLVALLIVPAGGCGKADFDPNLAVQKRELAEIHDCYTNYLKTNERPPTELSQLKKYEAAYSAGLAALKDGKYIVVWGVKGKDAGTLLAYEKDVPTNGGVVLMADGTVKTMAADNFKSAKPAP